ncbi:GNAT family N-acetyltransferase [uncultured Limosilactobacillus sp.]|uniref:GNAT family N-acetyltransferase n=1 Tax=uncultured Limosilactobacillus sp. TaxID=2837629 RepID=UPI0025D1EB4F|nr:GNAT family N-acetyltransferase [uncultured Limosilactobacillus sp.]
MNNDIMIIPTSQMTKEHRQLYLNADPDEQLVKQYLPRCSPFELRVDDELIGVILLEPLDKQTVEIKNLAIDPQWQHHGYGKALVQFAKRYARLHGASTLVVGTGSTSMASLLLYQKCGFRITNVDRDFFTRHYQQPIYENGIRLRDMVRLAMTVK